MKGPKAPRPVDPQVAAQAQTGSNIATASANQLMQTNQVTPYGSLTSKQTGSTKFTDPSTGIEYDIPQMTSTTSLAPQQQQLLNAQTGAATGLANQAGAQTKKLGSILGQPLTAPGMDEVWSQPKLNTGIANAGAITKSYGANDFSADRTRVEQALMSRMNPALDQARQRREAQLSNQGIKIGSEAFGRAQTQLGQNENDANMQAILAGGQEQSRLTGLEAGRAGFQNQAQAQQFSQNATQAQFGNDANQAMFDNRLNAVGFNNAARGAEFGMGQQARSGGINEILAMLGGGQVQNPQFANTNNAQMPNVDVAGLMGQQFNQQNANYQQQVAGRNQMMGGLFGLGAAGLMMSDERLKDNIEPVGAEVAGNPVYSYEYKADPGTTHIGVMAQDVLKTKPEAVVPMGKYLGVNYKKLVA